MQGDDAQQHDNGDDAAIVAAWLDDLCRALRPFLIAAVITHPDLEERSHHLTGLLYRLATPLLELIHYSFPDGAQPFDADTLIDWMHGIFDDEQHDGAHKDV